ncbi:DNA helicase, partial [Tanacetum coccineum]
LLEDDQEWEITLEEVALTATPAELRTLLAHILAFCQVSDPVRLWNRTWKSMSEDIPYTSSISLNIPDLHIDDSELEDYMLYEVEGKTFLWKTIIFSLHFKEKIVIAVASSSLLLPAGRIAHSCFKIPLDATDTTDESPMNDHHCFETLDRTLRDLLDKPNRLFGGKMVMLGRDFRQTLLVKKSASRIEVIQSSVEVDSERVSCIAQWLLDVGNRDIGTPDESDLENSSWINIPEEYCIPVDKNGISNLIRFIYDDDTLHYPFAAKLQDKAIVCPRNDTVDVIPTFRNDAYIHKL